MRVFAIMFKGVHLLDKAGKPSYSFKYEMILDAWYLNNESFV